MQLLYPRAQYRPLGTQTEPSIGVPRVLIWHTMSGYLGGTESMFRADGYSGTESTFGLGGRYDPSGLDGVLWQWQTLDHQADAQMSGNTYATSIECSDGARDGEPFTAKQIESSIALGVWWCQQTGRPATRATSWDGYGFGYHSLFRQWNPDSHDCPGDARVAQLVNIIWPGIRARLAGGKNIMTTLDDGDIQKIQQGILYYPLTIGAEKLNPLTLITRLYGASTREAAEFAEVLAAVAAGEVDVSALADAIVAKLPADTGTTKALLDALAARLVQ